MDFFFLLFFGVLAWIVFSLFTKRGRGMMFGGKIIKTLDGEIVKRSGIQKLKIRVHAIEKKNEIENAVTLEISQSAVLAWSMTPINLSNNEARQLITLLEKAVRL